MIYNLTLKEMGSLRDLLVRLIDSSHGYVNLSKEEASRIGLYSYVNILREYNIKHDYDVVSSLNIVAAHNLLDRINELIMEERKRQSILDTNVKSAKWWKVTIMSAFFSTLAAIVSATCAVIAILCR